MDKAVILIKCEDRKGLLAQITGFFFQRNLNILQCQQYTEIRDSLYFMRIVADISNAGLSRRQIRDEFSSFAADLKLEWHVYFSDSVQRAAILVSKTSHCLVDLLVHVRDKDIDCEVPLIISNHPQLEAVADMFRIPFFFCPIVNKDKEAQEAEILNLLKLHRIDLVVLARYMQILSPGFIEQYPSRIINIHHAFLPAFQGGNPYERAWERGVKMIGATAHYATSDLDEGPIIEQDVERITHEFSPDDMRRRGTDIERRVLTRAVRAHIEHKIILSGRRAIVFS